MTAAIVPIATLLLSVAFLLMGNGLQGTLLPVRAQLEDFGALNIGILGSSYFMGFALGCFFGPRAVMRVGHIRVFAAMVSIASTISILHVLILSPQMWWVFRGISGFCFATLYLVIESWLNEKSTNTTRGQIFSIYTIINLTVITVGQMLLTLADPLTFTLFGLASVLVSLSAVPVAFTKASPPAHVKAIQIRPVYLFMISPVGLIGSLAVGLANGSFWTLAPIFAQSENGNVSSVAVFMSVAIIAGAAGQYPLGRLSDSVDRRKVIILASLGAAMAGIGLTLIGHHSGPGFFGIAALFGFFAFPIYALAVAHLNDFVEEDGFVEAASGLLLMFAAGAVVGPLIASALMRFYGVNALFAYTATVHIAMAAYAFYRLNKRAPAMEEDRVNFVDSIRVAQTVAVIDPLSDQSDTKS